MTREEIIAGLKAGRILHMDGTATERELTLVQSLIDEGIAEAIRHEGEQYVRRRKIISWRMKTFLFFVAPARLIITASYKYCEFIGWCFGLKTRCSGGKWTSDEGEI